MEYISKESIKAIRDELNRELGDFLKFKVRRNNYSSGVIVTVSKGLLDLSAFTNAKGIGSVNHYKDYEGTHQNGAVIDKITEIMRNAPARAGTGEAWYSNQDYTAYYMHLNIGESEAPYQRVEHLRKSSANRVYAALVDAQEKEDPFTASQSETAKKAGASSALAEDGPCADIILYAKRVSEERSGGDFHKMFDGISDGKSSDLKPFTR